jgi:rubrerythrin
VLYHALEGAQTTDIYVKDAEQEGDKELAQFFRQIQQDEVTRADKAKQLLAHRVKVQ